MIAVDVSEAALDRLRQSLRSDWPEIESRLETTTDSGAAVREADIICTATTSRGLPG